MLTLQSYKARSKALYADIAAIAEKHGFTVGKITASIDPTVGEAHLSLALGETEGDSPEALRWKSHAATLGLDPDLLGRSIPFRQGPMTIAGLLRTRSAKNVLVIDANGGRRVCTVDTIKASAKARRT